MNIRFKIPAPVRDKFRFGTLSFIFIVAYINVFQLIFGPENSIVGVIFTIMMSASMARDLTAAPVRHLIAQSLVLVWMALAAYWVNALPMPMSFMINFVTLLGILYAFTYEYSSHLYFPYILSYLFLIYISPVSGAQLPRRLMAMLAGAVSIMLYQWFMGRKRVVETAKDVLCGMIDMISHYIDSRLEGSVDAPDFPYMRSRLYQLSRTVYERRKRILCISDASFYMVDAGRGLEHLLVLINELPAPLCRNDRDLLINVRSRLAAFHSFLQQETGGIPLIDSSVPAAPENSKTSVLFQNSLNYIRDRLLHMTDPQNRSRYRETSLSFRFRLMAALDVSPVRAVYALRTALVLSAAACLVRALGMPHGRWLLFTLASVSLPYADDVPAKTKKRILATITGGLASVVIYSLVPSAAGRTAAMMLSGYLSFYFTDYAETFACSTIGALGGAVFMNAFGFWQVGNIFIIRLGYILAGAALGLIANCYIIPYSRSMATRHLLTKYQTLTELLTRICSADYVDTQLYYSLVIQAHLQEEKLASNAYLEDWAEVPDILAKCREKVHNAHRMRIEERMDAPVFEAGHLV